MLHRHGFRLRDKIFILDESTVIQVFIMTAEGHLLFAIASAVFAKNAELTPVLAQADWWHILPAAVMTCLLPDIDHPKSLLGQRLPWISKPIARIFGHRGFTHSLFAVFAALALCYLRVPADAALPGDVLQGMVVGYLSHIAADMLTPAGVPLLWPCRFRFRIPLVVTRSDNQLERMLCIILCGLAIWLPQSVQHNEAIRWSSQAIDTIQSNFQGLLNRQTAH